MFDVRSFKISKNDHIIDVQQFDDVDFVCPYYTNAETPRSHRQRHRHQEYYVIYRVSTYSSHYRPSDAVLLDDVNGLIILHINLLTSY